MCQLWNMPLDTSVQDMKSRGLEKIINSAYLNSAYACVNQLMFHQPSIPLDFWIWNTASKGVVWIFHCFSDFMTVEYAIPLRWQPCITNLQFLPWHLIVQWREIVFLKLWEFNHQLCSHGFSSKVLGLMKGNVSFGNVHSAWTEAENRKQKIYKTTHQQKNGQLRPICAPS